MSLSVLLEFSVFWKFLRKRVFRNSQHAQPYLRSLLATSLLDWKWAKWTDFIKSEWTANLFTKQSIQVQLIFQMYRPRLVTFTVRHNLSLRFQLADSEILKFELLVADFLYSLFLINTFIAQDLFMKCLFEVIYWHNPSKNGSQKIHKPIGLNFSFIKILIVALHINSSVDQMKLNAQQNPSWRD